MTVQNLINAAVLHIADIDNLADYDETYLPHVTIVVGELMRLDIGVVDQTYKTEVPSSPDYTSTIGMPIKMPTDLTDEDQIKSIILDSYDTNYSFPTETHSGSFYVFVPSDYIGDITVKYAPLAPVFTTLTETLPISDSAAYVVASYGLAALFSTESNKPMTNYFEDRYKEAKAAWRRRKTSAPKQIKNTYSYD